MDWTIAIHRNRTALLSIIVALMASLGLVDGGKLTTLPFYLYRKALLILRPAEAAVRRLIVMAAYDLALRGITVLKPKSAVPFAPPFAGRRCHAVTDDGQRRTSFNLIDPLKTFGGEQPDYASFGQSFTDDHGPQDTSRVAAAGLGRRLLALNSALNSIEKQALRLTRWYAIRDAALGQNRPHRLSPLRPGLPPYNRKRPRHEVETVLAECHGLALYARARRDSS